MRFDWNDSEIKNPNHQPSKALIANGTHGGCVLEASGPAIEAEMNEVSDDLADLGLDDAPEGISIWEGDYVGIQVGPYDAREWESEPRGKFRQLTESEWEYLRSGVLLWP